MCSRSSFPGIIVEIPGISVDNFENPKETEARAYFLSHCHTDHTNGLNNLNLRNVLSETKANIYMSERTAAIIAYEDTSGNLKKFIKPLPLGTNEITLPATAGYEELIVKVTLIPAGHSFGSVMFLFRTGSKTVLYTGDFRISSNDVSKYSHFHDKQNNPIHIDAMYLDTTFIDSKYEHFPRRSESIEEAIETIRKWLEVKENRVALGTPAKFAYEFVFNEIYKRLNMKTYVCDDKWKFYRTVSDVVPGLTNDANATRIHLCVNRNKKTSDHSVCLKTQSTNQKANYLYVHLSAMLWDNYKIDENTSEKSTDTRLNVCFATHCSRNELLYFVSYFNPNKVVGFPNDFVPDNNNGCVVENGLVFTRTPTKRKVSPRKDGDLDIKVDFAKLSKMFDF